MPKINQALLDRLVSKLGVGKAQVYSRIQQIVNKTMLDRHLAALKLASDNSINILKYSTSEERALIRGAMNLNGADSGREMTTEVADGAVKRRIKPKKSVRTQRPKENSVFVVHGRNEALRRSMFDFLRALGLKPLEWEKAVLLTKGTNPYIGEILDVAMQKVGAVVVLFSPDDEARLKPQFLSKSDRSAEKQLRGQPRPNVLFEAGLALGRHPEKTIVVEVGGLRKFSDIAGKHVVRLTNDYAARNDLANRLDGLGCKVDKQGTDWTKTGDFTA